MKLTAVIEKSDDGLYSIYTKEELPKIGIFGYGFTIEEAKKDYFETIEEGKEMDDEIKTMLEEVEVEFVDLTGNTIKKYYHEPTNADLDTQMIYHDGFYDGLMAGVELADRDAIQTVRDIIVSYKNLSTEQIESISAYVEEMLKKQFKIA